MDQNQHDEEGERLAGNLLVGGDAIKSYLIFLGWPEEKTDPYYLKRSGWPIGKTSPGRGGKLIATKTRLARHTQKIAAPSS
jgi:hypothetical protein